MVKDGITWRALSAGLIFTLASATSAGALVEPTVDDAGTGDARVVPLSNNVAAVQPGESQWVAINWTSLNADARELKVTAVGSDGVNVSYPTHPVDGYSSGYMDDTLSQSEVDYTALKLSVADDAVAPQSLVVTVSYVSDTGQQSESFLMPLGPTDSGPTDPVPTTTPPTTAPSTSAPSTSAAPTTAPATTTPATTAPSTTQAPRPEVLSFMLVNSKTDTDIRPIVDGDVVSRSEYGRNISVVAIANDITESVRFQIDGRNHRVEQYVPYSIQGDIEITPDVWGDYARWNVKPGDYTINAIPFPEDNAAGDVGIARSITITITD